MSTITRAYESFLAYRMMTLLSRPFTEWPGFEMGLIDEKGKKIREPKTSDEKDQFTKYMNIIRNLKRTLNRISGGTESKLGNLMVGAALLKEEIETDIRIEDPDFVISQFTDAISARYLTPSVLTEAMNEDKTITPGRYKLECELYEQQPVFYIKEEVYTHEGVARLEDVLGRMYFVAPELLKRI